MFRFEMQSNSNTSGENVLQSECDCEECRLISVDWTKLSNTEKMVKALLLRAKFAAELNELL